MALDSFSPAARNPASVQHLEIILTVTDGEPNSYSGRYTFDVLDQDGERVQVRAGNLVPHLTAGQVTNLKAFLDTLLTKAQGAV